MDDNFTTLRVTATEPNVARVLVRRHQFLVGRPIEFDQSAPRIAALDYALGATGAEIVNGLRLFAARRRVDIDAIEAVLSADLENALAYLEVIGEPGRPIIRSIHIKVFVACADQQAVRELFDRMLDNLPLTATLRLAVRLTTDLIFST